VLGLCSFAAELRLQCAQSSTSWARQCLQAAETLALGVFCCGLAELNRDEMLSLAPAMERGFVRVPKTAAAAATAAAGPSASASAPATSTAPLSSASGGSSSSSAAESSREESSREEGVASGGGDMGTPSQAEQDALRVLDFRVGRIVACEKHPEADR
jgi:tRNA-binding EMAP/Myf-like protein